MRRVSSKPDECELPLPANHEDCNCPYCAQNPGCLAPWPGPVACPNNCDDCDSTYEVRIRARCEIAPETYCELDDTKTFTQHCYDVGYPPQEVCDCLWRGGWPGPYDGAQIFCSGGYWYVSAGCCIGHMCFSILFYRPNVTGCPATGVYLLKSATDCYDDTGFCRVF